MCSTTEKLRTLHFQHWWRVIQQLEGAFALVFKSIHYPGEAVATRRGSPLLIGVRSKYKLSTEQIPVLYRTRKFLEKDLSSATLFQRQQLPSEAGCVPSLCWDQVQTVFMQLRLVSMFSKAFYHVYFQICTQAMGAPCGSVT